MDRGLRFFLAIGVLLGGVTLACCFRRTSPESELAGLAANPLVLRDRMASSESSDTVAEHSRVRLQSPSIRKQSLLARPFTLSSMEPDKPPPELGRSYRDAFPAAPSRWGTSIRLGHHPEDAWRQPERIHTVIDGDTLRELANRYLGDRERYLEIYSVNKNLLPSPDVLPLGVDLKIPSEERPIPDERQPSRPERVPVARY